MSIVKSMQTSVSGLNANSEGMSVIANNIANSNTKGYKYERSEFEDMLSVDLQSGDGQIGRGVKLGGVKVIHSQGSIQTTDSLSDLTLVRILKSPEDVCIQEQVTLYLIKMDIYQITLEDMFKDIWLMSMVI